MLVAEAVTGFVVVECFVSRTFVDCGFRKLSRLGSRLATEKETKLMTAFLEIDTGFGLKKFQFLLT